jgi:hypothetical protein
VFVPLLGAEWEKCVETQTACTGGGRLTVLPVAQYSVVWPATEGAGALARLGVTGGTALDPIGTTPDDPAAATYLLPVLDLAEPGGPLRALYRNLDDVGKFTPASELRSLHVASVDGPALPDTADGESLGQPVVLEAATLTAVSPILVAVTKPTPALVYALRVRVEEGRGQEILPMLSESGTAILARGPDGRVGLAVGAADAVLVQAPTATIAGEVVTATPDKGRSFPWRMILLVVVGAALLAGAVVFYRWRTYY